MLHPDLKWDQVRCTVLLSLHSCVFSKVVACAPAVAPLPCCQIDRILVHFLLPGQPEYGFQNAGAEGEPVLRGHQPQVRPRLLVLLRSCAVIAHCRALERLLSLSVLPALTDFKLPTTLQPGGAVAAGSDGTAPAAAAQHPRQSECGESLRPVGLDVAVLGEQRCGRLAYSRKGTPGAVLTRHSLRQPGKCKERIPWIICERNELSSSGNGIIGAASRRCTEPVSSICNADAPFS